MRDIKFRAWSSISSGNSPRMVEIKYGEIEDLQEEEGWKVMQFTGLKDKNGVGIYEGDVLLVEGINHSVVWNDSDAGFGMKEGDAAVIYPLHDEVYNPVVIGNIHENPELLE